MAPFTIPPSKMKQTRHVLYSLRGSICDGCSVSQKQGVIFIAQVIYISWSLNHHSNVIDTCVLWDPVP